MSVRSVESPVEESSRNRSIEAFLSPPPPLPIPLSLRDDLISPKPVRLGSGSNLDSCFGMPKISKEVVATVAQNDPVNDFASSRSNDIVSSRPNDMSVHNTARPVDIVSSRLNNISVHNTARPVDIVSSRLNNISVHNTARPVDIVSSRPNEMRNIADIADSKIHTPEPPHSPPPEELTLDQLLELEGFRDEENAVGTSSVVLGESAIDDEPMMYSSLLLSNVSRTLVNSIPDEVVIPPGPLITDSPDSHRPERPLYHSVEPTVTPVEPVASITHGLTEESLTEAFYPQRKTSSARSMNNGTPSPINPKLSMSDYVSIGGQEALKKLTPEDFPSSILGRHKFESTVFVEDSGTKPKSCCFGWSCR